MKINVGRLDQILRMGISLFLIYIGFIDENFIYDSLSSYTIGVLGALSLIVSIIRFCPLYTLAGINTCQIKKL